MMGWTVSLILFAGATASSAWGSLTLPTTPAAENRAVPESRIAATADDRVVSTVDVAPPTQEGALPPGNALPPPAFDDPSRTAAFADVSDDELFDRAADSLDAVRTLTAQFTQVAPSGNVSTGDLAMKRPGNVRFDYDDPNPQLIVATGGTVFVHDAVRETTDSYPVKATPLRFLLSKRLDRDAAVLRSVQRDAETVTFLLGAKDDEEVRGDLAVTFSAPDLMLKEWAVIEPDGAATVVALDGIETGTRLAGRLFTRPDDGGTFLRDR